jgi:hypothetical protein
MKAKKRVAGARAGLFQFFGAVNPLLLTLAKDTGKIRGYHHTQGCRSEWCFQPDRGIPGSQGERCIELFLLLLMLYSLRGLGYLF